MIKKIFTKKYQTKNGIIRNKGFNKSINIFFLIKKAES